LRPRTKLYLVLGRTPFNAEEYILTFAHSQHARYFNVSLYIQNGGVHLPHVRALPTLALVSTHNDKSFYRKTLSKHHSPHGLVRDRRFFVAVLAEKGTFAVSMFLKNILTHLDPVGKVSSLFRKDDVS